MKKILVISPSGEVYDHDSVRWYSYADIQRNINHYHNIGDAFVFDSSLKLLNFCELEACNIRNPTDAEIDRYNAEFDYVFLRGSNYLHPYMDWENAPAVLARLKLPILAFGIGAQAPARGPLQLSEATKQVVRLIAERSVSIGVRGAYTADVLWSLGLRETRIVGCPTVFRNNDPNLRIDLSPLSEVHRVAYTLRREVGDDYAQDVAHYLATQRDTILQLAQRFDLAVLAQGELEEKKILWGHQAQRDDAIADLRGSGWLQGEADPMEALYRSRLFYSDVVADFERLLRSKDLVLGFRLHGNLMGLANGVPAIYFTYDSRTVEFAETLRIPSFDVFAGKPFELEAFWDQSLFDRYNRAYYERYRAMMLFLDENGIDHKMQAAPQLALRRAA